MQRRLSWLLTVCMLLIGSGAVHSLHEWAEAASAPTLTAWNQGSDSQNGEHTNAPRNQHPHKQKHNEDSCPICVTLGHLGALSPKTVSVAGLLPIADRDPPTALHFSPQADVEQLNCRGPPVC
ncbi:MAG TPA: DUF2946 family protein [Phycisphaerales bacterium]|nr:DUF2946 family protein [Phycisphaerales bacterium]